jgi:plastocyanin
MSARLALVAPSLALVLLAGCSSKTSTSDGGAASSSGSSGATGDGGSSGGGDSGATVNGCTSFKDETAAVNAQGVLIPWDVAIANGELRCVKVKVGTTVTFEGNFTTHPLTPQGGDTPSPFAGIEARISNPGTPEERAPTELKTAGTFGFACTTHSTMKGAILVVP